MRLHPDNARQLFALVKERGVLTATVVITGEEPRVSAPAVARPAPNAAPAQPQRARQQLPPYQDPRVAQPYRQPAYPGYGAPAYQRPQPGYEHLPPPPPGYMYAPAPPPGYRYAPPPPPGYS